MEIVCIYIYDVHVHDTHLIVILKFLLQNKINIKKEIQSHFIILSTNFADTTILYDNMNNMYLMIYKFAESLNALCKSQNSNSCV